MTTEESRAGHRTARRDYSPTLDELAAYCLLWQLPAFGPRKTSELVARYGSALDALRGETKQGGLFESDPGLAAMAKKLAPLLTTCEVVDWSSDLYPQVLKAALHPPTYLFLQGDPSLLLSPNVAIVGTRGASDDGKKRARQLVRELVKAGITITSGLALGIDGTAHQAAFDFEGRTIAVIGTPLDRSYPSEHKALQARIAAEGLVISQYPFFQKVGRGNFPERNRTMASVSDATVVIEAGETSGVRSQVKWCLTVGKPLFLAKSMLEQRHDWVNDALEAGAQVLESAEQVTEAVRDFTPNDAPEVSLA